MPFPSLWLQNVPTLELHYDDQVASLNTEGDTPDTVPLTPACAVIEKTMCGLPSRQVADTVERIRNLGPGNLLGKDPMRSGAWTDPHDGASLYYICDKLNATMRIMQKTNAVTRIFADVNAGTALPVDGTGEYLIIMVFSASMPHSRWS